MQTQESNNREQKSQGIHKNVKTLGWVSFFTDASSEMLYPIIPFFLTITLGAPAKVLGIMEGVAEAVSAITKGFSGTISDRLKKRKIMVFAGYSLSSLAKLAMALSSIWPVAASSRFLERTGKGIRTPARDALIADVTDENMRGRAFGFHRAMDTWGAVLGAGLAYIFLLLLKDSFRSVIFLSLIPAFIAVFLILRIKEGKPHANDPAALGSGFILSPPKGRTYRRFVLVYALFSLGASSATFLILRARSVGFSYASSLLPYIFANIIYAASSEKAGKLSDIIGRKRLLLIGMMLFSSSYALMFFMVSKEAFFAALFLYGFYMTTTEGIGKAFIIDMVNENDYGRALGFFYLITGISTLISSSIAGILWDEVSERAPFLQGAIFGALAAFLFVIIIPRSSEESPGGSIKQLKKIAE